MWFHQIGTLTRPSRSAIHFGLGVATIEVTLLARPKEGLVAWVVAGQSDSPMAQGHGSLFGVRVAPALVNRKSAISERHIVANTRSFEFLFLLNQDTPEMRKNCVSSAAIVWPSVRMGRCPMSR